MSDSKTKKFIDRAYTVHGGKYDYSKVNYTRAKDKVEIICPDHGAFFQTPDSHYKCGCAKCSGKVKYTRNEFLEKALKTHGDKYVYSKVVYKNVKEKVEIICPEHGSFLQSPQKHISGQGCKQCSLMNKSNKLTLTSREFIEKAQKTHGFKYDYSKINYKSARDKIEIVCPEHGSFLQVASYHLSNNGCPICGGTVKLNKNDFIERSKKVHGNKYDYSRVNYLNNKEKVEIICPEHGPFWQTPSSHYKNGCAKCSRTAKLNKDDFIERSRKVHGNKFDYSKVEYVKSSKKVEIICPEHGSFFQTPESHYKCGCAKCSGKAKLNRNDFIERSRYIHGNKYDYSRVNYKNGKEKVEIICSLHGSFWQSPTSHYKHGCSKCSNNHVLNSNIFIERSRYIHGNKYDYSRVNYRNSKEKVEIICPEHGSFWQQPTNHFLGKGCSICANNLKYSTSEVINLFKLSHGSKYDYSRVVYKNAKEKVEIICPEHGSFWQQSNAHISGNGCRSCAKNQPLNSQIFVKRSRKIHGNKYDYSRVNYRNSKKKVEIICPEHGSFFQNPFNHLWGKGCLKCITYTQVVNTLDFIEQANKIHDNHYDYSKVNLELNKRVKIICKKHGIFTQRYDHHLGGSGCPTCRKSKGEKTIFNYLKSHKIKFVQEARLLENYRFDFWLPENGVVIEYNGRQHYEVDGFFIKTKQELLRRQKIDKKKRDYILKLGFEFLEIPYWEKDSIEEIMDDFLMGT